MDNAYLTPEHELLREQVARLIAREVEPQALAWEEAGFLGLMVESAYGRAEADALADLVFAEALSKTPLNP